jgi:hypothetical protein
MSGRCAVWAVFTTICLGSIVSAQSYGSPERAIVELALASDLKAATSHLPLKLVSFLKELSPQDLQSATQVLLPLNRFGANGVVVRAGQNGLDLLLIESPRQGNTALRVSRRIADGADAVLQMEICVNDRCYGFLQIWLRLEEGDWRIVELEERGRQSSLKLDDPKFYSRFRNSEQNSHEETAIGTLGMLGTALLNYSSSFGEVGFPQDIAALAGNEDDPSAQHAGLVDMSFETKPCIREGYKFEYSLIRQGTDGAYSITARPTQFGKTGTQSFYVDETGVIRATKEDRLATADDDPIQ